MTDVSGLHTGASIVTAGQLGKYRAKILLLACCCQEGSAARARAEYVDLPSGQPGDEFLVRFAVIESSQQIHLGYQSYEVHYRGDTVTAISPPGKIYPLYQREWTTRPAPPIAEPSAPAAREIDSI